VTIGLLGVEKMGQMIPFLDRLRFRLRIASVFDKKSLFLRTKNRKSDLMCQGKKLRNIWWFEFIVSIGGL
jgi:hypothetical protein